MKRCFIFPQRSAQTLPPIPTGLVATPAGASQINLTWNAVTPTGVPIANYKVYRQGAGLVGSPTSPSFSNSGLISSTSYTYNVSSLDVNGLESPQSTPASATTASSAPLVPTGLAVVAISSSQLNVSWNATTDPGGPGLKDYGLYRNGVLVGYQTGLTFSDTGLTPNTTYGYQVSARDIALNESAKSSTVNGTTQTGAGAINVYHGQTFTISGSGFGTKSGAWTTNITGAETVGTLSNQWNGGSAPQSSNPTYTNSNPVNRATNFNPTGSAPGAPNTFVSGITAGAHFSDSAPWQGVSTVKFASVPATPYVVFIKGKVRLDALWSFTTGEGTNDHNLKGPWSWAPGSGGIPSDCLYGGIPLNISSAAGSPITSSTINDNNSNVIANPDRNGNGRTFSGGFPNWWTQWVDFEIEICADPTHGLGGHGYIKVTANGALGVNYAEATEGTTLTWTGSADRFLSLAPSLFVRDYGPGFTSNAAAVNNWWYVADVRAGISGTGVTGSFARVIIGDQPTLAASTVREVAVESSWSNTSIQLSFWQGSFAIGQTCYAHVVTQSGAVVNNAQQLTVVSVPSVTFDFYISPTGNDTNPGTLSLPWSPASLGGTASTSTTGNQTQSAQVIANQNLMKGKRIGLLPGNYAPATYCTGIGGGYGFSWQFKGGGTAGAPTIIQSTTPRGAVLSLSQTFDGNNFTQTAVPADLLWISTNYVTLKDIAFNYSNSGAFVRLWNIGGGQATGDHVAIDGCSFQNVDTSVIYGSSHDNLNMIEMKEAGDNQGDTLTITNSYFNGCLNNSHALNDLSFNANAIGGFSYSNVTIDHCEFANVYSAYYPKGNCGNYTFTNNFIHDSFFLMRDINQAWTGFCSPNAAVPRNKIANNIAFGVQGMSSGNGGNPAQCNVDITNNTIACTGASGARQMQFYLCPLGAADSGYHLTTTVTAQTSTVTNNILYPYATIGPTFYFSKSSGAGTAYSNAFTQFDYNCHTNRGSNTFSVQDTSTGITYTITSWRAAGNDVHSIQADPGFAGTPGNTDPKVFKLSSGSACKTSGNGGVDMGAWGGTVPPTQIGVDWRGY